MGQTIPLHLMLKAQVKHRKPDNGKEVFLHLAVGRMRAQMKMLNSWTVLKRLFNGKEIFLHLVIGRSYAQMKILKNLTVTKCSRSR